MKKNSLSPNGLSLSQAQSISNLCNQRAREIEAQLIGINNCSKEVDNKGKWLIILTGKPLPANVVELLQNKSELHACQAFLMENIKAKDNLLKGAKSAVADTSSVEVPKAPVFVKPTIISEVGEDWGWEQLSINELCEYHEAEAYASHIGQFIHQSSVLDNLRKELPTIAPVEWMTIKDGQRSPIIVKAHHTSEQLLKVHEELAGLHRDREQRVNYFKAKVKNLVTIENSRIAKINADAQHDAQKVNNESMSAYQTENQKSYEQIRTIQSDFEKERQENISKIASLRIDVHPRFQKVVDMFLKALPQE